MPTLKRKILYSRNLDQCEGGGPIDASDFRLCPCWNHIVDGRGCGNVMIGRASLDSRLD